MSRIRHLQGPESRCCFTVGSSRRVEENPVFCQSLRERLEEIIERGRQERLDAAGQLSLLNSLREGLQGEQAHARDIGLDARGFAICGLLEQRRPMAARRGCGGLQRGQPRLGVAHRRGNRAVHRAGRLVAEEDVQRQMRSKIKRQLRASGMAADAIESLAADIVDLANVRTDQ